MRANAKTITIDTGKKFAEALVAGNYLEARSYLTANAQKNYTPDKLAAQYRAISGGNGPVRVDGHYEFLQDWADRQAKDIGWVYISISGSDFAEAVTVVVSDENGTPKIRSLEWGRP